METIRNVTQLLIAKDLTAVAADGDVINSYADLLDGEVALCTPQNVVTDGTDKFLQVKFIQRSGTKLIHSDIIDVDKLLAYNIGKAGAETQQLDYIGFNGVSGALDTIAQNIYTIRLYYQEMLIAGFMQQKIKEGFYKSNAVATSYTQQAVARGLQQSLIANYSREAEKDIKAERVNGGAALAALGNITFTEGSKYIVSAIDDTANILVGSLVRATADLTSPTYVVVGHDGGAAAARVYELDTAWNGATIAAAAAAETVTEGDWGIQLQGVDRHFKLGFFASRVAQWKTTVDFGDAALAPVSTTAAYPGTGTGQQISTLEKELQADEFIYRGFDPHPTDRTDAVQTNTGDYDVVVIEHKHELKAPQGTPTESAKCLNIAFAVTGAQADTVIGYWQALLTLVGVAYTDQTGNLT